MTTVLPNGQKIPVLALGTWQSKPGEVGAAVKEALRIGYRHIDCAMAYMNEEEIGNTFAEVIPSQLAREDVFVTSKLWNTKHKPESVLPACQQTLKCLRLDYLDLYLIHWPIAFEDVSKDFVNLFPKTEDGKMKYEHIPVEETWRAMEELVDRGLVKSIGISNFNASQVDRIMAIARIKPVVNQVEAHVFFQQKRLREHMRKNNYGMVVQAFSPLANGNQELINDPLLTSLAAKYGKSPAQIMIRFLSQSGFVVLPKSVNPQRIAENFNTLDFHLSEFDMHALEAADRNLRVCFPAVEVDGKKVFRDSAHPEFPFNAEY